MQHISYINLGFIKLNLIIVIIIIIIIITN